MNTKLCILVAAHKPCKVYADDVYCPIHVGRAISKFTSEDMNGIIGDDTGDNISAKNGEYCELTAIYWAWKNLPNSIDYVGLAHYSRYFETKFNNENIEQIFHKYDVILAKPFIHDRCLEFKLARILEMEDEVILLKVIKKYFPEYEQTVINYLFDYRDYSCNMFVMPRQTFNEYCEFLFSILFECDKLMRPMPYTCSQRRMGYIGEFLLPIFCLYHKLHIHTEAMVPMVGDKTNGHGFDIKQHAKVLILKAIYNKHRPHCIEDMCMQSVLLGLNADGIHL